LRIITIALGALTAFSAAPVSGETRAATGAPSPLADALAQAAAFCEASLFSGGVQLPPNTIIYMRVPRAAGSVRPLSELPELVKRFAATQPMGRTTQTSGAVKFAASEGEVWAVNYGEMPACDLMVTKGSNVPALAAALVRNLDEQGGWENVRTVPASASMPLSDHVLRKLKPQADDQNYGFRLRVRWPIETAADQNGIQLEMSYLAGTMKPPAPIQ
jgi:hypothetical protein